MAESQTPRQESLCSARQIRPYAANGLRGGRDTVSELIGACVRFSRIEAHVYFQHRAKRREREGLPGTCQAQRPQADLGCLYSLAIGRQDEGAGWIAVDETRTARASNGKSYRYGRRNSVSFDYPTPKRAAHMQRAGAPKGNSVQVHATNNQSGLKNETLANMRENAILQGETSHASVAQLDRASVFVTDDGNPQSPCSSKTCEISEPCDSHSPSQTPV